MRRGAETPYRARRPGGHPYGVVIYVDLLTQALGTDEARCRSSDLLLADLVLSRTRLRAADTTSAAEALARELSYDATLIRLCASVQVPASPRGFTNPPDERARLEQLLTDRGVDLESEPESEPVFA